MSPDRLLGTEGLARALVESAPDALVIVDAEGRILLVNAQAERLFGSARGELVGRTVDLVLPGALGAVLEAHRAAGGQAPRPAADRELLGRHRDGRELPVDVSLSPIETELGTLVAAAIRDASERRRVAAEAGRSEALFRGLLESAPDAMVVVDREARIVLVNAQADRMFGYGRDELLGQPVEVLIPLRFRAVHEAHRDGYLRAPATRPMGAGLELLGRRRDGSEFPVDVSLSSHGTGDEQLVVSAVRDVTDQRRVESEIRRLAVEAEAANAAKSEFLSRMSHELRTPLNAIIGFAQLLELDGRDERYDESVRHILTAGRHLLSLINEVLDMAQIESGRVALSLEPVLVAGVVDEAVDLVAPLAAQKDVTIVKDPPPTEELAVVADQQRLLQVVLNLVDNAVKYNVPAGRVRLSWARHDAGFVRIAVEDTGPGIEPRALGQVFLPFERLTDRAAEAEGTGLGLSVSRSLIEAMGGTISAESTPGRGSTFTIELAEAGVPGAYAGTPRAPRLDATRTVLHIEDNIISQRIVERIVARLPGVRLVFAMQGSLGIELARRRRPDLILLDLHLRDLPGERVLAELRADPATAGIPVVILTADASRPSAERLLSEGARAHLTKPIDAEVLLAIVEELTMRSPAV